MYWGPMDQRQIFIMISYFDAVAMFLCMIMFLFLIGKQKQFESDTDILQTTPADYTIFVDNLPDDVGAEELSDYFERALSNWDADVFTEEELQGGYNKIAEVVIHRAFASVLQRSLEIADEEKQLHIMLTEMKVRRSDGCSEATAKAANRIFTHLITFCSSLRSSQSPPKKKVEKLRAQLDKLQELQGQDLADEKR